eukprot:47526-Eustigmatos_ZCMA.PRE.1
MLLCRCAHAAGWCDAGGIRTGRVRPHSELARTRGRSAALCVLPSGSIRNISRDGSRTRFMVSDMHAAAMRALLQVAVSLCLSLWVVRRITMEDKPSKDDPEGCCGMPAWPCCVPLLRALDRVMEVKVRATVMRNDG